MKKIICADYNELSILAADIFAEQLGKKPDSVFGLATGSTPLGLYEELSRRCGKGELDFSKAVSYNLDEYYPISRSNEQSYYYFMQKNLFSKINLHSSYLPNGEAADPAAECAAYDSAIAAAGGIDLQLLGIGMNGHIGFNEPAEEYSIPTHRIALTESTLNANSRFFVNPADQPKSALTMGFGAIFSAKKILLLISGKQKAHFGELLTDGKIHTGIPASLLSLHPDITMLICG